MKKFLKNKYNVIITLLFGAILFLSAVVVVRSKPMICDWNLIKYNFRGGCVPDEESAIEIAKVVYKARSGIDFESDEFKVSYDKENNAWNVRLVDYKEEANGGYPTYLGYRGIYIDKDYATIVRDYFHMDEVRIHRETKEKYLEND